MSSTIGLEHAARIIAERGRAANDRAWQIRKGEILRSEIPLFFAAIAGELKEAADTFNAALALQIGIEVNSTDLEIMIRSSHGRNLFSRKINRKLTGETVVVATDKVCGYKRQSAKREILFEVRSDGTVLLEGRNFLQVADDLLKDAVEACAENLSTPPSLS